MISIRFGLRRLFLQWHKWNIINDCEIKSANDIFGACLVKIKKKGNQTDLAEADMRKMYASEAFSTLSPRTLQQKVFFELMLFFCNRGRENLRNMKPSDYEIRTDSEGRRYVGSRISRLSKKHRK
jgi:hypothetical protein